MTAILDQVAAIVYAAAGNLGGTTWDVTVKQKGAATVDAYGGFTASSTDYTGRGFLEDYTDAARQMGGIPLTDRKALLFTSSFTSGLVPAAGDMLTVEGSTLEIISVKRDPASATWALQVR
jgi:hypothetical protein